MGLEEKLGPKSSGKEREELGAKPRVRTIWGFGAGCHDSGMGLPCDLGVLSKLCLRRPLVGLGCFRVLAVAAVWFCVVLGAGAAESCVAGPFVEVNIFESLPCLSTGLAVRQGARDLGGKKDFQKVRRRKKISGEIPRGGVVAKVIFGDFLWWCKQGSVKWGPISKERENEVERKNLYESELLQEMASIIRGSTKVAMDLDDPEKVEKEGAHQATGKRPRNHEGLVADALGKKRALEEAHRSVMRTGPRLPSFDLQAPSKLPFGMEDVYAEGAEKVDFSGLRQQNKEVNLAVHRQEVPLVNVFLEGMKSDPEVLARTPATSYADRAQKTLLTQAYAYVEMYVNMTKADKEIQRLKRRNEMAKDKIAEAQEAIQEKNTLVLQKAAMAKEMEKLKRSWAEEVVAARAEAIESFRGSEELRSYIMDQMVAIQLRWEDRVAMFNPSVNINFDTSGEPPSSSPTTDAAPESEPEPATTDAPSTES
ncbi:unnamed protein product [Prunus armeniaca]